MWSSSAAAQPSKLDRTRDDDEDDDDDDQDPDEGRFGGKQNGSDECGRLEVDMLILPRTALWPQL